MARPFAPTSFGIVRPDFHAGLIEMRLAHSGEYVRHITLADVQWVVVNYQYIPAEASITGEYVVSNASPKIWGYIEHFEAKPTIYRAGDSVRAPKGSQFEIRGLTYNVKKVEVNHVGYMYIDLVLDDKCQDARPEFFEEQAELTCTTKPDCSDA